MQHASFQIEHESDRPLAMFAALILSEVRDSVLVQKPRSYAVSSVQPAGGVVQLQSGEGVNLASEMTVCSASAPLCIKDDSASAAAAVDACAPFFRFPARTSKRSAVRLTTLSHTRPKAVAAGRDFLFRRLFHTCSVRRYDHALGIATGDGVPLWNGDHYVYCIPLGGGTSERTMVK